MMSKGNPDLTDTVRQCLSMYGWDVTHRGTAIGTKVYETAVGPKEALVFLTNSKPDDPNRTLRGEYVSEGRNVMPGLLIPKATTVVQVEDLVRQFAQTADAAVADSYAVRLLRCA
jgi:hypothetical protein